MSWAARGANRPRRVRGLSLLVLAVVAGVLAMHGLAPVPMTATPAHGASPPAHVMPAGARDCAHPDHEGGGHLDHADGTCAAAGTSTGPALSALTGSAPPSGAAEPVAPARRPVGPAPDDRAPPSLSELQLLRI
ncbi:DUF6153 family protein [Streptomyces lushanensis]|uniref:DUF6153 family protein n=1 Tax=Streptomyces lushanensis TaxID=1434255 RepID=UPI00082EC351|nr:DUF6153 family protein [Streptomyces lushanensis]